MLNWAYFPRSAKPTTLALGVVKAFQFDHHLFTSDEHTLPSNSVLAHVGPHLSALGFIVETGKKKDQKVHVPALYGNNGKVWPFMGSRMLRDTLRLEGLRVGRRHIATLMQKIGIAAIYRTQQYDSRYDRSGSRDRP